MSANGTVCHVPSDEVTRSMSAFGTKQTLMRAPLMSDLGAKRTVTKPLLAVQLRVAPISPTALLGSRLVR